MKPWHIYAYIPTVITIYVVVAVVVVVLICVCVCVYVFGGHRCLEMQKKACVLHVLTNFLQIYIMPRSSRITAKKQLASNVLETIIIQTACLVGDARKNI